MKPDAFFFAAAMFTDEPPEFSTADVVPHGEGWAHLPKFILYYLMKFLNLRTDPLILRAVCRSWRSALPLCEIPKLPLGFDSPKLPHSNLPAVLLFYTRFFLLTPLTDDGESNSPWIVRVADVTSQLGRNEFQLRSVVDGGEYFSPKPPLKGRFNLLDCKVDEVGSCFSLFGGRNPNLFDTQLNGLAKKVVGNWDLKSGTTTLLAVLAKLNGGGGLGFLKLGHNYWIKFNEMKVIDENKSVLDGFDAVDYAFYDGEFYAFDLNTWKIGVFDPNDFGFDDVPSVEFFDGPKMKYVVINGVKFGIVDEVMYAIKGIHFVPACDGLYLVFVMSGYESGEGILEKLVVFELDEDEWEWKKVESIGEQVFFIGEDVAFSVPAEKLPLWKPGSICLFTMRFPIGHGFMEVGRSELPNGLDGLKYPKYWKKFRVFNMEEEEKGVVGFEELSNEVYTRLFFPPPKWVKWTRYGVDDVVIDLSDLKLSDDTEVAGVADGGDRAKLGAMTLEEVE